MGAVSQSLFESSDSVAACQAAALRPVRRRSMQPLQLGAGRRTRRRHRGLRDLRPAQRRAGQCHPGLPRHQRRLPCRPARRAGRPGLVGHRGRPGQSRSTPTVTSSSAPTCWAAAAAPPAPAAPTRRPANPMAAISRPSRSATWSKCSAGCWTHLGISQLLAVVGGSLGGHQALTWATRHPDCVRGVVAAGHLGAADQPGAGLRCGGPQRHPARPAFSRRPVL